MFRTWDEDVRCTAFEELKGQTLASVINNEESVSLKTTDGRLYVMFHEQDCCEYVSVEDINGDVEDVIGEPILLAEEVSEYGEGAWGTETWTFYKLATIKGTIVIRWYGSSNGYYSESVSFAEVFGEEEMPE